MAKSYFVQRQFSSGEIDANYEGRTDSLLYQNGAKKCKNFFINANGGMAKRQGFERIIDLPSNARILSSPTIADYGLILIAVPPQNGQSSQILVYNDNFQKITTISLNHSPTELAELQIADTAFGVFLVHENYPVTKFNYNPITKNLSLDVFSFTTKSRMAGSPFAKMASESTFITPSGTSGLIILTANIDYFTSPLFIGQEMRVNGGEVIIYQINSPREVRASVRSNLTSTNIDYQFSEAIFSRLYGYPRTMTSYRGRLIIGGCRSFPNRIYASKILDNKDFSLGANNDDDGIEVAITAQGYEKIQYIYPGRYLQIFTDSGEWIINSDVLTPSNISVVAGKQFGIAHHRQVAQIDNKTIFVSRYNNYLAEQQWSQLAGELQTQILNFANRELTNGCHDLIYQGAMKYLFAINKLGNLIAYSQHTTENIYGFSEFITHGQFISLGIYQQQIMAIINNNGNYFLAKLSADGTETTDFAQNITINDSGQLPSFWQNKSLSLFDEQQKFLGIFQSDNQAVIAFRGGNKNYKIGANINAIYQPLPRFENPIDGNDHKSYRLLRLSFNLYQSQAINLIINDTENLLFFDDGLSDEIALYDGWYSHSFLGWHQQSSDILWWVRHNYPYKLHILSTKEYYQINQRS